MIDHKCECGAHYRLQDELYGQEVQCYKCGRVSTVESSEPQQPEPVMDVGSPTSEILSPEATPSQVHPAESEPSEMPSDLIPPSSESGGFFHHSAEWFKTKSAISILGIALPVVICCVLGVIFLKSPNLLKKINPFGHKKQIQSMPVKSETMQNLKAPVPVGTAQKAQSKPQVAANPSPVVSAKTAVPATSTVALSPGGASKTMTTVKKPQKPPAPPRVRVVTSDGSSFSGILIDKDDVLATLKSGDGEIINLPIDELVSINGRDPRAFLKYFVPVKAQSEEQNPIQ